MLDWLTAARTEVSGKIAAMAAPHATVFELVVAVRVSLYISGFRSFRGTIHDS